jgi:PAS domain S-box-containing protein
VSKTDEQQKAILNNIPDQAWLKDVDSRYILVNEAFVAACRLPEQQILNRTPVDVWPENWGREYIDTDRRVIEQGVRLRYEERRHAEDGTLRWYDTIKTPIRDEHGDVIGTTGISRDITDRKLAEQELLESRSQLRELSAYLQSVREEERTRISRELHDELGQSLTAIRIGLGVMETQLQQDGQSVDSDCSRNLQQLKRIADSTVESVQRIAADLRPLILDELGLASALDWLLESFAERGRIAVELIVPPALPVFSRDISTAIFRILQEALTNVSRHSRATSVVVELKEDDHDVMLKITDNGCGIDAADSRENSLGLIGMRERAFMLGGTLKIQSRQASGTSIDVRIPKSAKGGDA